MPQPLTGPAMHALLLGEHDAQHLGFSCRMTREHGIAALVVLHDVNLTA